MNKIKSRILTITMMIATLLVVLIGCQKEDQISEIQENETSLAKPLLGVENCNATIKNGYLVFTEEKDINAYYKYLETHSDEDIDNMEIQNNFMSYNRKIEQILQEYEVLNEDKNTTMEEILSFREIYKEYITITDEDFFPNIEGLGDRLINPKGYMQVGEYINKYVNKNIYTTSIENFNLLENNLFSSELIGKSEVKVIKMEPSNTDRVYALYSNGNHRADHIDKRKCGKWRKTTITIREYHETRLHSYTYGNYSYGYATSAIGYHYYLKNLKRGWTGIWYGKARASRNQGNYISPGNNGSFNDYSNSITTSRNYIARYAWTYYANYSDAYQWSGEEMLQYAHGYIEGTVYYDVCGSRTWSY